MIISSFSFNLTITKELYHKVSKLSIEKANFIARNIHFNKNGFAIFDVYYNSTKVYDFPLKAYKESPFAVSLIYTYESPIVFAEVSVATVMNMLKSTDGAEIMKEVNANV